MDAKKVGLTELANLVGTAKQNIERWANGERALKPDMAEKLAPFLDVSAGQLLLLSEGAKAERSKETSKEEKMGADALASLRAALIAYGVDKAQLATLVPVIDTFVKKAKPAQSEQTGSRDQSQPATPRRA